MTARFSRQLLLLLVLTLAIAACSGQEPSEDPTTEPTATSESTAAPEPSETAEEPSAQPTETSPPADEASPSESSGAPVEPVALDVDFEERAPDNTTVRVTRFEVTDLNIAVDVEIIVPAERAFVQFNNTQQNPAAIVDDAGNTYPLIPPEGNSTLMIDGGERLEGTLSFQGPLKPGVKSIQLVFNPNSEPGGSSVNDQIQPHFTFPEVPLDAG